MTILPLNPTTDTPARRLPGHARQRLALDALAGVPFTRLAHRHHVSRKFVRRQRHIAQGALDHAFDPTPTPQRVLFHLPVTRAWIEQLCLGLLLVGHCSLRGVHEILRDLFDVSKSVAAIQALAHRAAARAATLSAGQDLSRIQVAALDEIFQNGKPVLAVVDTASTYCGLLAAESHRDGDTWGVHLLDLQHQGFAPCATIADGGLGLRAGVRAALPGIACRADVWHALRELGEVARFLEKRAYDTIAACDTCQRRLARARADEATRQRAQAAQHEQDRAVALADDVTLLADWLRRDVLARAGPTHPQRLALFDFVWGELAARAASGGHRLGPVCARLARQKADLLEFAAVLDADVADVAAYARVSEAVVREVVAVQELPPTSPRRWPREAALRQRLGGRSHELSGLVQALREGVRRASSVVENVNSRLRGYFFLRKNVGGGYLDLLRFVLNHRRFLRSEHPERVGQSAAEWLRGVRHPHGLELLGYERFRRAG